ncbi:AAA family ATPase [Roseovarius aestuarii]|uniref:non-specific protein-tyrosine kinase n=1 Tax=Roseovarius aestuarii TaxID=475083 RepID=A0A1X7BTE6_9RHOB|nr:AAA family ATPase [Roseovarius aestuarii]SMC12854.1 Tyrosine-protein kinase CpsD [Roseovarius aestuarii]
MNTIGIRVRNDPREANLSDMDAEDLATLGDLRSALRRQYKPVLLGAFAGLVLGALHYLTSPPQYYTFATVLVDDRMGELAEEITASIPFVRNDTSLLNEIEVLQSLQLAIEVTRKLGLHHNEEFLSPPSSVARSAITELTDRVTALIPGREEATPIIDAASPEDIEAKQIEMVAFRLQRDVRIARVGRSFSVDISFVGFDPELSTQIVNTYAEAYLEDHLNANLKSSERTATWMRNRMVELQASSKAVAEEAEALRRADPGNVQGLRELARRATTLATLQKTISERHEQIAIQGSFPVSNGRILTHSIVPETPALPKAWRLISIAGLLGLMFGFAIAVLREMRERFFRVGEDVSEYTGQTFLGYLPHVDFRDLVDEPWPECGTLILDENAMLETEPDRTNGGQTEHGQSPLVAPHLFMSILAPGSLYSETLRNIHTTLEHNLRQKTCRVVAAASMLPGEGKTTFAANYANMAGRLGERVLLIDADLRHATLSIELGRADGPGLVEVLRGSNALSEALCALPRNGPDLLPCAAGRRRASSVDVLYQQNMTLLIEELRKQYDVIVIDLPSLGTVSDAKAMLSRLDKIIFVCAWGKTPRSLVSRFFAQEPAFAKKVLGVVLNRVIIGKLSKYARSGDAERFLMSHLAAPADEPVEDAPRFASSR